MNSPKTVHPEHFSKKLLLVLLAVSILTNGILLARLKHPDALTTIRTAFLAAPNVVPTDHVRGNPDATFTVIEYADFLCPYCAQLHGAMNTIIKETDTRWVFRPLPNAGRPLAKKAAEAAECAGDQGKFWEYGNALFETKATTTEDSFLTIAQDLGLDWLVFSLCMSSGKHGPLVETQIRDGVKNKVTGTPTFYLNGKRFTGFVPLEELRKLFSSKSSTGALR